MGRNKIGIAGIILLTGIAGCNVPELPQEEPLAGKAYLDVPLDNAKITFETASGDPIETTSDGTITQGRFFERLSLAPPLAGEYAQWFASNLPLTLRVTGGTVNGTAFDGTLLGYADSFSPDNGLHINILTTLILKYKQAAGVTLSQAEIAVVTALGSGADLDLVNQLNNPNTWFRFNPAKFMTLARANGGFDAFTDQVVANMVGSQDPGFDFVGESEAAPEIGSKIGSFLIEGVGVGLVRWGVNETMGWILTGFSSENSTTEGLDEIKSELDTMNSTLTTIQTEIGTLTTEVSQLLSLVQLEWADLTSKYDSMDMSDEEGIIQNQYKKLLDEFPSTNPNVCTPAGNTLATAFAQQMLGTYSGTNYDIDQQLYNMYANITGKIVGSNGALYDITTELIDQVKGGEDLLDCYYFLENYFGQLAAIQSQGLELMNESIHQQGAGATVTATDYYNKFTGQMDEEVELFLYNVDRLVIAAVNVRSEIVQKFNYLPMDVTTIYSRADFVANQLSSQQPSGLIVRLIGDPNSVSDWVTNNKIHVAGQNLTRVSVNGNTLNNYPAAIPTSTPGVAYYLTWTPNGNVFTFNKETNVSVVKLQYPATTAGSFTVTTPTQTQTLSVAMLNGDFQPASAADSPQVAYGSGVFYVRTLPTWQAGTAVKTQDVNGQWSTAFTPNPAGVSMGLQSYPYELHAWLSCPVVYTGKILSTLCNGGSTNLTLNLNWNGTQNTTDTWSKRSGAPPISSNQSLLCQSATQESSSNGQAMTLKNVSLAPNTNTSIYYQAQQQVNSTSFANNVEYGDSITTNAFLTSLEIIPQP
jgi:hypothetical protein